MFRIFVTGAGQGIGAETVRQLVEAGHAHVRDVDVTQLAVAGLVHLFDIAQHPAAAVKEHHRRRFAGRIAVEARRQRSGRAREV